MSATHERSSEEVMEAILEETGTVVPEGTIGPGLTVELTKPPAEPPSLLGRIWGRMVKLAVGGAAGIERDDEDPSRDIESAEMGSSFSAFCHSDPDPTLRDHLDRRLEDIHERRQAERPESLT